MNILHSFSHTDLALELKDELEESCEREQFFEGITVSHKEIGKKGLKETVIKIENEAGEKQLGKPQGIYITLEGENMAGNDGGFHEEMSNHLAKRLAKLLLGRKKLLFIGLGNGEVTPDALGPLVIKNLFVTRHLKGWKEVEGCPVVAALAPGVMAQTGMETFSIVKGIVDEMKPDLIIAIDSLAARNISRVTTTIQLTDTGIIPGSGIGNNREGLNRENLGCTVIAIGVPMVVHSVTIVNDTMDKLIYLLSQNMENNCLQKVFEDFTVEEKYQLFAEIMTEDIGQMFVTPKDVDEIVDNLSTIIANSINRL